MNSPISLEHSFDLFTGVTMAGPATRFVQEQREQLLAAAMEELAGLRFSLVITARWEASGEEDPQRRQDLRIELDDLRSRYLDKIDEIAMTFGVAQAIEAKEDVERNVTVPLRGLARLDADLKLAFGSAHGAALDAHSAFAPEPADDDFNL